MGYEIMVLLLELTRASDYDSMGTAASNALQSPRTASSDKYSALLLQKNRLGLQASRPLTPLVLDQIHSYFSRHSSQTYYLTKS